jgi:hypothetical protein
VKYNAVRAQHVGHAGVPSTMLFSSPPCFGGDIAVVHGDAVLSFTNIINDMNKGGVVTPYEDNISALYAALGKVQKDLALEEERRQIAEDQLKPSQEEVAIFRDKIEDLFEEDKYALPTVQDYNRCVDEKLRHRMNGFWAEADAKLVAELAKAKAAADIMHFAELADAIGKF